MHKKLITFILTIIFLIAALPTEAQIRLGVKGGYNLSKVSLSGNLLENLNKDNQEGFFAGITTEVNTGIGLGADIAVLYDQKRISTGYDTTEKLEYIDIPFNVKYAFGLGSFASVYIATGPQFAFNISGKNFDYYRFNDTYKHEFQLRNSEFSWNVGAGITLFRHMRIGYNYNIAIDQTANLKKLSIKDYTELATGELKNNTQQVSLTILF